MRFQSRSQSGLQASEGLAGIGGYASKLVHSHKWWVFEDCYHVSVSLGLPECMMTWHLASSRGKCPQDSREVAAVTFMTWPQKPHTISIICSWKYISVLSTWEGATQGHQYHEVDIPVGHMRGHVRSQRICLEFRNYGTQGAKESDQG